MLEIKDWCRECGFVEWGTGKDTCGELWYRLV